MSIYAQAFAASTVARLFAPLWAALAEDRCETCGANLRDGGTIRACPVCPPPRAYRLREHQRNAVVKVGVVGAGAVIYEGICANA